MITLKNLVKTFGTTVAVNIPDLQLMPGEITGIAGNNGAGKTTLLRLMLDLLKPDKGTICSKGKSVYQSEHWKKYTGSYIDQYFLIEFLRPAEYFEMIACLYGMSADALQQRLDALAKFTGAEIREKNKYIRHLSSGNKHKVGITGALIPEPEILILDEPFNFLDPGSQLVLKGILGDLAQKKHTTIILSSHNLHHISSLCGRILLIEKGEIIQDMDNSQPSVQLLETYFECHGSN